jgi:hypothetical protein
MDARRGHSLLAFERTAKLRARVVALPQAAAPALGVLVGPRARRCAAEVSTTLCVVGGFLAAPLLTILAFVGLAMPGRAPLHQAATTLLLVAVVWLSLALVGAHVHHDRQDHQEADE